MIKKRYLPDAKALAVQSYFAKFVKLSMNKEKVFTTSIWKMRFSKNPAKYWPATYNTLAKLGLENKGRKLQGRFRQKKKTILFEKIVILEKNVSILLSFLFRNSISFNWWCFSSLSFFSNGVNYKLKTKDKYISKEFEFNP